MVSKKKSRQCLLSSTRPNNVKPASSLSSKTTRTLVRSHHNLRKKLASALATGDTQEANALQSQIDTNGGLRKYQEASIQGQSAQRGGDTSKILVEWLSEFAPEKLADSKGKKLRMLEVGALRTDNACSRAVFLNVERIDLHSQHPDIKEQDFMKRPLPEDSNSGDERFDIVSLSLVLNFVSDPAGRGDMLRRVASFLRCDPGHSFGILPALFLVLPAPCVTNSRYLNEDKLEAIMRSLGYTKTKRKMSAKLVYYLWRYNDAVDDCIRSFKKEELRSGKSRNNYAIVL